MNSDNVLGALFRYKMIEKGDTVIVGLSGGADSVCLTHALNAIKNEYALKLTAAHVNHGIRGAEADRDENFCREFCEKLGIRLEILKADIPALSRQKGIGEEECGRLVRYEFFNSLAGKSGKIATAHNLNDSAETLIFNLARGTALKGAGGIPPVRDNVIRPLIMTSRNEIEGYCRENSLEFVTDSTNLENEYTRNKIRNKILPLMREINTEADFALSSFCEYAREDDAFLTELAEEQYEKTVKDGEIDETAFLSLPESLKRRLAAKYLSSLTERDVSGKNIEALISLAGTNSSLETLDGIRLKSRNGKIFVSCESAEPFEITVDDKSAEYAYPYGKAILKIQYTKDLQNLNKEQLDKYIDCDKISGALKLRSRKEGDRITLAKRGVTKTLKKLFIEDRIPQEIRNTVAVLVCEDGVVWAEGYGVSKKFRANANSDKIMSISIEEKV